MNGLISDYIASYRDHHITPEKFREDMSNPEIVLQEDLADFILDCFDRKLLKGVPELGHYDRIQIKKKPPFIPYRDTHERQR